MGCSDLSLSLEFKRPMGSNNEMITCNVTHIYHFYHCQSFSGFTWVHVLQTNINQTKNNVKSYLGQCFFYLLHLDLAHHDSGMLGFALKIRWPEKQYKHSQWTMQSTDTCDKGGGEKVPTCTTPLMTWGSMLSGNLRMLNSESDTKAFSASRMLSSSTVTYTANVVNATCKHINEQGQLVNSVSLL